jgi:hypothetical protein
MAYLSDIHPQFPCARNRIRFRVAPGDVPARKQRAGSASPRRSSSIGCRSFSRVASQLPTGESKGDVPEWLWSGPQDRSGAF